MRYLTVLANPGEDKFVSVFNELDSEKVKRDYMPQLNLLVDVTIVLIYHLRGDLDRTKEIFDKSTDVMHYDISEQGGGLTYLHYGVTEPLTSLLSILQKSEVIMTMPIKFLRDDRLRVTFIGEREPLHRTFHKVSNFIGIEIK